MIIQLNEILERNSTRAVAATIHGHLAEVTMLVEAQANTDLTRALAEKPAACLCPDGGPCMLKMEGGR